MKFTYVTFLLFLFTQCQEVKNQSFGQSFEQSFFQQQDLKLKYSFNSPHQAWKLPNALEEVSGISILNENTLVCVQDEKGIIYFYDTKQEEILKKEKFYKDADYEDLAVVDSLIYVLRSNGNLYKTVTDKIHKDSTQKIDLDFEKDLDIEGLCYDKDNNRLLIAVKNGDKQIPLQRDIFSYDLNTQKLIETPVISITKSMVLAHLESQKENETYKGIHRFIREQTKRFVFQPSAIAIHPITKNIYITSSVGKLLFILTPSGSILHIIKLNKKLHRQPEGLAFYPNGDLLISSEGKSSSAKIFLLKMKK